MSALPELTNDEILRYSRHLILPEVGLEGQRKLKAAKVLMVGTGGLGAPLGLYLAAAGVGKIGIVDFDVVRRDEPATAGDPRDQGRGASEDRLGRRVDAGHQPVPRDREVRGSLVERKRARHHQGLRHRRGRDGQLPDAVFGQRRLRAARQAQLLRLDLSLRGAGDGVPP